MDTCKHYFHQCCKNATEYTPLVDTLFHPWTSISAARTLKPSLASTVPTSRAWNSLKVRCSCTTLLLSNAVYSTWYVDTRGMRYMVTSLCFEL